MMTKKLKLLVVGMLLHVTTFVFAGERLENGDFATVVQKATELSQKYGVSKVLLVYDIDNTLLAMNQELGSDQWFNWQASKITTGDLKDTVAPDFAGLLSVEGKLYSLSKMHPPQENTPAIVAELQAQGFPNIALTSRGSDLRNVTLQELKRNGYDFSKSAIRPERGYPGTYLPYQLESISDYGLSQEEVTKFKLGASRPVSYMDGVFMGSGQHKGVMLRTLLWKTKKKNKSSYRYKAIVFVDDGLKNCDAIQAAFENQGVDLVNIRYTREDENVKRFQDSDKSDVIQKWNSLHDILTSVFGG